MIYFKEYEDKPRFVMLIDFINGIARENYM